MSVPGDFSSAAFFVVAGVLMVFTFTEESARELVAPVIFRRGDPTQPGRAVPRQFLEVLGLEAADFEPQLDQAQSPVRREKLTAVFLTRTRDAWCAAFDGTDACIAPVLDLDEAPNHPHNRARRTFLERDVGPLVAAVLG